MNYMIVELSNDVKYAVIDILEYQDKKYFLLGKVLDDGTDIDSCFDICLYNEESNRFEEIEDEILYNNIKVIFEKRLDEYRQKLIDLSSLILPNLVKLKIINILGNSYTLEKINGEIVKKDILFFCNIKFKINNYIYIDSDTLKNDSLLQYGTLMNTSDGIIKVIDDDKEYYLQRYYG